MAGKDGLEAAVRSPASNGRFDQFGRSLRYAVTTLADLDVAGHAVLSPRGQRRVLRPEAIHRSMLRTGAASNKMCLKQSS